MNLIPFFVEPAAELIGKCIDAAVNCDNQRDLENVRNEARQQMDEMKRESEENKRDLENVRNEARQQMDEMKRKSEENINNIRRDNHQQIAEVKRENEEKINEVKRENDENLNEVKQEHKNDMQDLENRHNNNMREINMRNNKQTKVQLNSRKDDLTAQLNEKNKQYELAKNDLDKLSANILTEEKEISRFHVEQNDPNQKVVVVLGMCGAGKSTFCNRMNGDQSKYGNSGRCVIGNNGASCTQTFNKTNCLSNITMIDTPGFGDPKGIQKDLKHLNELCKYMKGCGGINAFILVRNGTNIRFDNHFQFMLKKYCDMFKNEFFSRLIIVASKIDAGAAADQFKENNQRKNLPDDIKLHFSLNFNLNIDVIPIGVDNYTNGLQELVNIINNKFSRRFQPKEIKSPLDDLKKKKAELKKVVDSLEKERNDISNKIKNIEKDLKKLKKKKRSISMMQLNDNDQNGLIVNESNPRKKVRLK